MELLGKVLNEAPGGYVTCSVDMLAGLPTWQALHTLKYKIIVNFYWQKLIIILLFYIFLYDPKIKIHKHEVSTYAIFK